MNNQNLPNNPSIDVVKAPETGLFTNYIYKAIPLAFDESMSYYETLCALLSYLKDTIIPTVNNNADAVSELQNLYVELKNYVDNYFTNLDVQQEINNKLDEMASTGELQPLLNLQYNELRNEVNEDIEELTNEVNEDIEEIRNIVTNVASGSPLVASSTDEMTDTSHIYVNTTDGKWYYYDGDSWEIGGTYQSDGIANGSIDIFNLDNNLQSNFFIEYSNPISFGDAYVGYLKADGTIVSEQSFSYYMISLENGNIYEFNVDNNYQASGIVIKDNSNNVLYYSQNNPDSRNSTTGIFKCNANNLTAYISLSNNLANTDIKKYSVMIRKINNIYNQLKYTNNTPLVKTIEGYYLRADRLGVNDVILSAASGYNVKMYQMSKGRTYNLNAWNYANVSGIAIINNTNEVLYASSTESVGDNHVEVNYTYTAKTNGYILLCDYTANNIYYDTSISVIVPNLKVNTSVLYGKKISLNGDSICYGAGYTGGYGKIISEKYHMTLQNIAVDGGTIASDTYYDVEARHWINATITNMDNDSDYAIVEGGVNDSSLNITLGTISDGYDAELDTSTYYGAFENMLKQLVIRFAGKKYGYIAVHQMTANYRVINNPDTSFYWASKKCCEKWGVPFLDLNVNVPPFAFMRNTSLSYLPETYTKNGDGWHPNENGYKKYYVDKIVAWLESL